MSRVGEQPIPIPNGVEVQFDNNHVSVTGPNGELSWDIPRGISVVQEDGHLQVARKSESNKVRSLHGLTRSLLANMVNGVTDGFSRVLVIHGTGYRAAAAGDKLTLTVGYSHPVELTAPEGITLETPSQTRILVKGADKQKVGQMAAEIRKVRPPEPYHGFGIRYDGERVRQKEGKGAAGA